MKPQVIPASALEAISHRGLRDSYPENTIPAFLAAIEHGAAALELDVHATRDGVVVVHHDDTLPPGSSSPLAGRPISSIESAELRDFELAPGIGIPTLADVLRSVPPPVKVYIEIKAADIEHLVAAEIAGMHDGAATCGVHSFDHRVIRKFATLAPGVRTGILLVGYPVDVASLLAAANARDLWQRCEFIDSALVSSVHASAGRVIAWTCNDSADWDRLMTLHVDGICTDRVAALSQWLGAQRGT